MAGGLSRWMHITGGPGTGKTEDIIHAAYRAAEVGARVLILCPTGALVHAYKESTTERSNLWSRRCTAVFLLPEKWI